VGLAAWDVHRAKIFGRCERSMGIAPFDRLVAQIMRTAPYCDARRVYFSIVQRKVHGAADDQPARGRAA
jgi:hypothetical protein